VYLRDIWPSNQEIADTIAQEPGSGDVQEELRERVRRRHALEPVQSPDGELYQWDKSSTYIKNPPTSTACRCASARIADIQAARALGVFGDSITTDHISPAGDIKASSPREVPAGARRRRRSTSTPTARAAATTT
jgi:aconitate hydratase